MTGTAVTTEQTFISAARRGDRQAFGELVRQHRDGVVKVVYRMCGDVQIAEEAAQEAFLRAWQHLDSYKPQHSFRSWVYRIAINAALDSLRREKPTVDLSMMEDSSLALESRENGPERAAENKERTNRIRKAVMSLPEASRAAIVLREYAGLTYEEIASALNIPLGTVMSRLNAARGQLRRALSGDLEVL